MRVLLLLIASVLPIVAQEPCSVSSPASDVQLFACTHAKAQSADLLRMLNMVLSGDLDTKAVLAKLAEVPRGSGAKSFQLTPEQKKNLLALAKMYAGQKASVVYAAGDKAAGNTANEIAAILRDGGWVNADGSSLSQAAEYRSDKPLMGIEVKVNDHDLEERQLPKAAIPLTLTLQSMGFARKPDGAGDVETGSVRVMVGAAQ